MHVYSKNLLRIRMSPVLFAKNFTIDIEGK